MKSSDFKVKFWGVRGSYPLADKDFLKYGGNTSCVEINIGDSRIILDCGTGIIPLGNEIFNEHISSADNVFDRKPVNITVLLSHIHQDHIQGLNFFRPLNIQTTRFNLFGYSGYDSLTIEKILSELLYGKSFPVNLYDVTAHCNISDINETNVIVFEKNSQSPTLKTIVSLEDIKPKNDEIMIQFMKSNSHPNFGVMCFKVMYKGKIVVYATDTECYSGGSKRLEMFAKDADLLIHDSQYTTEDYLSAVMPKQGYGHSTFDMAFETAQKANVKKLAFFHFDPSYNDEKLENIENFFININKNCFFAKEGLEVCI
ncbi:MAG: MBL fold metallo-hydrolase [Candidatus Gastranaerophilales bacterium]|nr:MBL fold metallo-hydrolase [Candidatus Gastranaerophilales bacterium]